MSKGELKSIAALLVVCVSLRVAPDAAGQSTALFDASGFQPSRDYVTPSTFGPGLNATEHVDPITGSLILTFSDLVLPGNGGRDLVFQRSYNSKGAFGGAPGQWNFGIAGIPLWVEDTWPDTPDFHPVLHTADGGGSSAATNLYEPAQGQAIRMTDRFWKYYRNSRIAWLPDGTVVNFDTNLRLSSVVDPFGNTILSLVYSSNGETVTVTQSLGAGQERVITVELPPDCVMGKPACVPTSMSYAGRTWTYTGGGYQLSTVTPPVGPPWQYGYGGDSSVRTMSVITPHGGSVLYTIQNLGYPWTNGETYYTNVVTARQASDVRGGQSSGTWSFDYDWETASLAKSSVVTAPDGTRTRYNYGFWPGLIENNGAALYSGRLYLVNQRKTWQGSTEPACNDALECETRQYEWLPIPSAGVETLPALTNRTIIRGGRTYSTSYAYSGNNYDDFHKSVHDNRVGRPLADDRSNLRALRKCARERSLHHRQAHQ